jgi:hypothetical protein
VFDEVSVVYVCTGPGVDVCGGRIGSSKARFCMSACEEGTSGCRFASHSVKADIAFPAYYIQAAKGTTAYCAPCVVEPVKGFSTVILNTLRGKRSTAEWTRIFPTISTAVALQNDQQLDMIARGEQAVTVGPTPMKRRVVITDQDVLSDSLSLEEQANCDEESHVTDQVFAEALVEPNTTYDATLLHIATYWNEIVTAGFKQVTMSRNLESTVQSTMEEVDDKVVQVSSLVGRKAQNSTLPLTLWSSLLAIADDVSACELHFAARYADLEAACV